MEPGLRCGVITKEQAMRGKKSAFQRAEQKYFMLVASIKMKPFQRHSEQINETEEMATILS